MTAPRATGDALPHPAVPGGPAGLLGRVERLLRDPSREALAKRTALLAFAIRVASAAVGYLAQVALARWMGTHDYGIYVFVWTWVLVAGSLSCLGFHVAATRFVPEHSERNEAELLRGYVVASRGIAFGVGTVVAALGVAAVLLFGTSVEHAGAWPLLLAFVCLPLFAVTEAQDGLARSFDAPAIALVPPYLLRPLLLLALMAGTHAAGVSATAATAMICAVLATWASGAAQFVLLSRKLRGRIAPVPRRYCFRRWAATALPLFVAEGARVLLLNVDVLILSLFETPEHIGIYYAVTKTLVLGAFVAFAVGAAVAHRYTEYGAARDRTRLQAFVTQSAAWTFWPTLAAVLLMLVLGRPFLSLFGPAFLEGYPLMMILSLGVLVRGAVGPADRLLGVLGEHAAYARLTVVTLAAAVALNVAFIAVLGITGAAIATAIAAVLEGLLLARAVRLRLGLEAGVWHRPSRTASDA